MADTIVCPICGSLSYSKADIEQGYCGRCHAFTACCTFRPCEERPEVIGGNIVLCRAHAAELNLPIVAGRIA